jgi:methylase of polypeptide subunit release factors
MISVTPLLAPDDIARLREALATAGYTSHGIAERIGPAAVAAVRRNDFRAMIRATQDGDRLATLIRVFLAAQTEPPEYVAAALAPLPLDAAVGMGLVESYGDGLHAGLDLDVYTGQTGQDWWVLSDVDADSRPGPLRTDHVLGIGNAATTLAGATIRRPVGTALDIGTGCGVQALQLSTHAGTVTATDISERALRFAATTAALNGMEWELLAGDMAAPVAGRRFDLVVSNPPFIVGPGSTRYAYRDSGRPGDGISAELAGRAGELLTEGGTMQFLANWLHLAGEDWRERVAGWVAGTGCDAWVIQREVSDPVEYVQLWLRDAAEPFDPARAQAWLDWFDSVKAEAVGFGIVTLRRSGHDDPTVRVEELRQSLDSPLGPEIAGWFDRQEQLRRYGTSLGRARVRRAPDLRLTQEATFGDEDWEVVRQYVSLTEGLRWSEEVDPVALALLAGADGSATVADQLAVLAAAFETPALAAIGEPIVAHLVERGFLRLVD